MAEGRIVVGVDGSAASRAALHWAAREARLRGAHLEVVHAWELPALVVAGDGGAGVPVIAPGELEQAAEDLVRREAAAITAAQCLEVTASIVRGHPAHALIEAARGADLLVVGSRGHGGFVGMLMGSVSNHVVHHAGCPVVVVRSETNPD